jgi:putative acetyltransferase
LLVVRREREEDHAAVRAIVAAAFARPDDAAPVEVALVDRLRTSPEWIGRLSLVAALDGIPAGQVLCSRAWVGDAPVLGLGPIAVAPELQRRGIGSALMHAVLAAADALDEQAVVLVGHAGYYPRFGFRPAIELGITPPDPDWVEHFQARGLSAHRDDLRGPFRFAPSFDGL